MAKKKKSARTPRTTATLEMARLCLGRYNGSRGRTGFDYNRDWILRFVNILLHRCIKMSYFAGTVEKTINLKSVYLFYVISLQKESKSVQCPVLLAAIQCNQTPEFVRLLSFVVSCTRLRTFSGTIVHSSSSIRL